MTSYDDWRAALVDGVRVPVDDVPDDDLRDAVVQRPRGARGVGRRGPSLGSARWLDRCPSDLLSIADELYALALG